MSELISCLLCTAPTAPRESGERTKSPELSLRRASVRGPGVLAGPPLELEAYLMGEESPIVTPEALGVRPPSLGAADCCRKGELAPMPLLPLMTDLVVEPLAGDERKNSGDEVRLFCEVSCDVRFALGVSCDCACCWDACDASERS